MVRDIELISPNNWAEALTANEVDFKIGTIFKIPSLIPGGRDRKEMFHYGRYKIDKRGFLYEYYNRWDGATYQRHQGFKKFGKFDEIKKVLTSDKKILFLLKYKDKNNEDKDLGYVQLSQDAQRFFNQLGTDASATFHQFSQKN